MEDSADISVTDSLAIEEGCIKVASLKRLMRDLLWCAESLLRHG
jgi:hypothetical protein